MRIITGEINPISFMSIILSNDVLGKYGNYFCRVRPFDYKHRLHSCHSFMICKINVYLILTNYTIYCRPFETSRQPMRGEKQKLKNHLSLWHNNNNNQRSRAYEIFMSSLHHKFAYKRKYKFDIGESVTFSFRHQKCRASDSDNKLK